MDCWKVFFVVLCSYLCSKRDKELMMTYIVRRTHELSLLDKMVLFYFKVSHLKLHGFNQHTCKYCLIHRLINIAYPSMENWAPKNRLMRHTALLLSGFGEKDERRILCLSFGRCSLQFNRFCIPVCRWDIWFTNVTLSTCHVKIVASKCSEKEMNMSLSSVTCL